ncbi:GSCOCG00009877001-RA-CDS [Cotesia congregata]|uniref:Similar to adgra3: Adhesion G protein-coupled receptor A3 (Danio rerio) n=1 Tax=Cotesia congregata TaxID=51543 RepID=A0A8J2EGT3_COTCN|nr:GSCOCG00009877001-RA-CDS [Cotesia congregata]CAG5075182.1 Similar to adgra3: Adhesion G protein-coupled receptor A3 (Danio rerio) [Cotesia congregata]
MRIIFLILCLSLGALIDSTHGHTCPAPCDCKHVGPQAERLKVKCNKGADIQDIKDINIDVVSVELYHLDLSKNNIHFISTKVFQNLTNLKRLDLSANKISNLIEGSFDGLENLERLDLSENEISSIDALAFRPLTSLKKLDLSFNKLSSLDSTLFHDLTSLERLKLNNNALKTLTEGTFYGLKLLRQLDLSNNPWECDCYLYWLSNWKNTSMFKLNPVPTCNSPGNVHGKQIPDLKYSNDFQCDWISPTLEISPSQNQVVFSGDSISLKCSAPSITDDRTAKLLWQWTPSLLPLTPLADPVDTLSNVKVDNRYLADSGIIDSALSIFPVTKEHNGQWNCFLVSIYGNKSKAINIIVISNDTRYCPLAITRTNKGVYAWPRTIVGWKVELPCEGISLSSLISLSRATYQCNATGHWTNLDTESCPFISPVTRALQQYANMNLSLADNLMETFKRFANYTHPHQLSDPIDLDFIAKTLENYLNYLTHDKDLPLLIIAAITSLLKSPKDLIQRAEVDYKAASRLISIVESVTKATSALQIHEKTLALEEFRVNSESFVGLSCTWYSSVLPEDLDTRFLHCATSNRTAILNIKDKVIEASIRLPSSLLAQQQNEQDMSLMVSMYSDSRLFPSPATRAVNSAVIGSRVIDREVNLTEPVIVMLKSSYSHPIPVIWNSEISINGSRWTREGCQLANFINNLVIFQCNRLGYYGLLEDLSYRTVNKTGALFRYSHPLVYIGTSVLIISLTITSVTYIICYASISMPKRVKHSVINTWISITLLSFLYTIGIQQTENIEICQSVGLILHYLSLCSLLWMAVSASNMYKRLAKNSQELVSDDEIPEQPIQKPLLGLYLVGWGIALIICGISGAVNLREYAGYSYCFLTKAPALTALFVPAIMLIVYLSIFYLLVRCTIRNVDHNGQLSEGTQATENMDLELLEPHENRDQASMSVTVSSEIEDLEHSQMTQLKGHLIVLVLFIVTWTSAAATTVSPVFLPYPYAEPVFSICYALSSSTLGCFVFLFYGLARSDVRSQWTLMRCWLRRKKNNCCRTRSVCDARPALPAQSLVPNLPIINHPTHLSDSNSVSSRHTNVSPIALAHAIKAPERESPSKKTNVNLVVLHRQQYRSNNSVKTYTESAPVNVEMFYNPHQSGVARKFFKKQRRHKHNNLGPRKQGDGGATSDGGSCISIPRPAVFGDGRERIETIFGSGAKVNNTNIHVELNPVADAKNVNMLSDSGSISEGMRYVIGQEIVRQGSKKVNNDHRRIERIEAALSPPESEEEKHLRNVSQQCSLEYSSEADLTAALTSERSDHNLPEIGETPETPEKVSEKDFQCSSDVNSQDQDRGVGLQDEPCKRRSSLYDLDFECGRIGEKHEATSVSGSSSRSRPRQNSRHSDADGSFKELFSGSLTDVRIPTGFGKDFSSLTDLATIDVTLGATRHLDMNASIGVDYEDTNYSTVHYTDDAALDEEMLLDNPIKKETSV